MVRFVRVDVNIRARRLISQPVINYASWKLPDKALSLVKMIKQAGGIARASRA